MYSNAERYLTMQGTNIVWLRNYELRTISFFSDALHYYNSFLAPLYARHDSKKKQENFKVYVVMKNKIKMRKIC